MQCSDIVLSESCIPEALVGGFDSLTIEREAGLISTPKTITEGPTALAAGIVIAPVPQARSSTLLAGERDTHFRWSAAW